MYHRINSCGHGTASNFEYGALHTSEFDLTLCDVGLIFNAEYIIHSLTGAQKRRRTLYFLFLASLEKQTMECFTPSSSACINYIKLMNVNPKSAIWTIELSILHCQYDQKACDFTYEGVVRGRHKRPNCLDVTFTCIMQMSPVRQYGSSVAQTLLDRSYFGGLATSVSACELRCGDCPYIVELWRFYVMPHCLFRFLDAWLMMMTVLAARTRPVWRPPPRLPQTRDQQRTMADWRTPATYPAGLPCAATPPV